MTYPGITGFYRESAVANLPGSVFFLGCSSLSFVPRNASGVKEFKQKADRPFY